MVKKNALPLGGQIPLFGQPDIPDIFRKAVQAVHSKAKQPLLLVQRKIGNAWVKHALITDPDDSGWWTNSIRDLAIDIGFDSNNHQYLKEAAEALMSIVFEWDVLAPEAKRTKWKASVMFPEVELDEDVVRYQFSSQLRETLLKPEVYALIDMNIVRKFRRSSALALWEQCVRFENVGRTGELAWPLWRDVILGQDASHKTYEEYKYFKAKVLKPALAEINELSEHEVTVHENKVGRRVSTLIFAIKRKQVAPETQTPDAVELISEMTKLAVPASEAKRLLKTYAADAIKHALAYTKSRMLDRKLSPLTSPSAYFRNALKEGYAQENKPQEVRSKPLVDIRSAYLQKRTSEAEQYFAELEADEQTELMVKYDEQQVTPSLRFGKKKASKSVIATFYGWLAMNTWGEPTQDELIEFAQALLHQTQA